MNASFPPQSERIRAYLDDTLDEDALEQFELELFSDPQLLDAVESERLLRQGLRDLNADMQERVRRLAPRPPAWQRAWPMAAALAIGLIPAGVLLMQGESRGVAGNIHLGQLGQLRSGGAPLTLQLPASAENLQLRIPQLAQPGVSSYRVEVEGPAAVRIQRGGLQPGSDGQLSLILPAAQLSRGDYTARVIAQRADGGSEAVGELPFRIETAPAASR